MIKRLMPCILLGSALLAGAQDWQHGFLGKSDFQGNLQGLSPVTEWEFDFARAGCARDRAAQLHDVDEPVFEDAGLRMFRDSSPQERDRLSLSAALLQQMPEDDFTVYVEFSLDHVDGLYQPVFEQTRRGRWWPNLQLAFSRQDRNHLILWHSSSDPQARNPKLVTGVRAEAGQTYEIVLTRNNGTAKLWVNGEKAGEISGIPVEKVSSVFLGCGGPEQALNGYLRTFAAWNRALSEAEVESIDFGELRKPAPVRLSSQHYIRHLARGFQPKAYSFLVRNTTLWPRFGLTFEWTLDNRTVTQNIGMLGPNREKSIAVPALIHLAPGDYMQTIAVKRGNTTLNEQSMPLTVTPAPVPVEHLQVSPWMQFIPEEQGYTMGTVARCADAMEAGLHWGPYHFRYGGIPREDHPQDRIYLSKERHGSRLGHSDFYFSRYMQHQMREVVGRIARRIGFYPALTHIDINNESTWNFRVNFSEDAVRHAKDRFGLDLSPWKDQPQKEMVRPIGRLSPQLGGYPVPENRIIPANDPLYRWHLDRKGPHGDSESLIDQYIAVTMKRERPDVQSVVAPITRRLAIRAYDDRLDIAQTWSYTPGLRVIWLQELLSAHIRYSTIKPSSFPAFLNMNVGPYNAMPSGDIFAASCWASLIRPTAMLVFFQAREMYQEQGKNKDEIDALLGSETPSVEDAKRIMKERELSLSGNHPTLVPRVRTLIAEELPPMRALLPEWRNYPRRIAVYSSVADRLFTDHRWPSDYTSPLAALTRSGVAYDIIFDEDFVKEPDLLDRYNMVYFPALQYLYEPAHKALEKFAGLPGNRIVVPENAYPFFQNATIIRGGDETISTEEHARIVKEVEAQWGTDTSRPMYIETLDEKLAEAAAKHTAADPWTTILDTVALDGRSFLPHSALNITALDDTTYISVVNDLRTWGPVYGHFHVLPEKGVRQSGKVAFNSTFGKFAYNLRNAQPMRVVSADNGRSEMEITLDGGDAAIIMFSDREIGTFKAALERDGDYVYVTGQALCKDDQALAISMPCVVRVEGSPDFSGSALFRNGRLMYRFPFEGTMPQVSIRELATGTTLTLD